MVKVVYHHAITRIDSDRQNLCFLYKWTLHQLERDYRSENLGIQTEFQFSNNTHQNCSIQVIVKATPFRVPQVHGINFLIASIQFLAIGHTRLTNCTAVCSDNFTVTCNPRFSAVVNKLFSANVSLQGDIQIDSIIATCFFSTTLRKFVKHNTSKVLDIGILNLQFPNKYVTSAYDTLSLQAILPIQDQSELWNNNMFIFVNINFKGQSINKFVDFTYSKHYFILKSIFPELTVFNEEYKFIYLTFFQIFLGQRISPKQSEKQVKKLLFIQQQHGFDKNTSQ